MITIIFAPPGKGKTCFLSHIINTYMFDNERNRKMREEIMKKQANGFTHIKTIPQHCGSCNYDLVGKRFRYSNRKCRRINPYKLGFANDCVETHFNLPYEAIGITEAQKYLNSRMCKGFPDWQSRWYEQHRHNHLDIFLDTQRPGLIDINVRELAHFIEIVNLDIKKDKNGKIIALTWTIRHIENNFLYERYIASGKKDNSCYKQMKVTANYNVFECYDSYSCEPLFYSGHLEEDFDYDVTTAIPETIDGYVEYLHKYAKEIPEEYYKTNTRSVKK